MDFLTILFTIFIQPLKFVFEIIFSIANRFIGHPGISIIVLSLIMNFLVLPLYKRADEMQEEQRNIEMKLKKGVDHIKKSFTGDERMMILQTYYRQNNYKPTDALNGSISLLLEIPFFIAAYQFLSHLSILEGVSLGPITNLAQPDGMLVIAGMTINVLPVLMTLVNVISSAIYLKGFPLKTKIQLYGMALFFLVFLYESPAGLVFYWTLNNVFSLFKNVFYKFKDPGKVLTYMLALFGFGVLMFDVFLYQTDSFTRQVFIGVLALILELPLIYRLYTQRKHIKEQLSYNPQFKNMLLLGLLLSVIIGAYIPSSVIVSSPEEFISITYFHNPLLYILYTFALSFGFFVIWFGVFYWLASKEIKIFFEKGSLFLVIMFVVNYMFFGTKLGTLLPNLQYENKMRFTINEQLINIAVIIFIGIVVTIIMKILHKQVMSLVLIVLLSFAALSGYNIYNIDQVVDEYVELTAEVNQEKPYFNLSKDGENVIVLLLDRALGHQVPYIFNEKPELKEQFEGFTYYSNVMSFGGYTNFGTPAAFGGYEYTPVEMNKRDDELLVDKHNEALKVLPHLFDENGYKVTVCDPSYANYKWVPDLSIYDEYKNMNTFITEGVFVDEAIDIYNIENNYRNFFCFSIMKSMPLTIQKGIYDSGNYHKMSEQNNVPSDDYSTQTRPSLTQASGLLNNFMKSYNVLTHLDDMTKIEDNKNNNFIMMSNNTTHEPMLLQMPDYTVSMNVDNSKYFEDAKKYYTIDGVTMNMETDAQVIHYHANMATFIQLGQWFDYMRENDVYDNTKIILVSDHGRSVEQIKELISEGNDISKNKDYYFPLLMIKDFNSKEFKMSDEFMTHADVPTLALKDIIENPMNPFTNKPINNDYKYNEKLYIIRSNDWSVNGNDGTQFNPSKWALVKDNIWNKDNWTFIDEETTSPR